MTLEPKLSDNQLKISMERFVGFLILVMFFVSDDTLLFGTNNIQVFIVARYIIYFMLVFVLAYVLSSKNENRKYNLKHLALYCAIIFAFLLVIIVKLDFRPGYFLQLLTVILAILYVKTIPFHLFVKSYQKILYFFAATSILVYFTVLLVPQVVNLMPTMVNYGGTEFGSIVISNVFKSFTNRNTSIFREPGVYANFLLLGIFFEMFYRKKINLKYLSVFIIALATTLSTSGFIVFAIILLIYTVSVKNIYIKFSTFGTLALLILGAFMFEDFGQIIFSKFDEDSGDYASGLARVSSFSVPLQIFRNNLFGVGLTNFANIYDLEAYKLFGVYISAEDSATNTILNSFAIYGFFLGALLLLGLVKFTRLFRFNYLESILAIVVFFLMFGNQEMRFSLMFNCIIMYGLFSRNFKNTGR